VQCPTNVTTVRINPANIYLYFGASEIVQAKNQTDCAALVAAAKCRGESAAFLAFTAGGTYRGVPPTQTDTSRMPVLSYLHAHASLVVPCSLSTAPADLASESGGLAP